MRSEVSHVALGPWGGQSGYHWDDGVYSGVRQVVISTSSEGIHFIQFEYDKKGHAVWSDRHGGNSGTRTDLIKLDYPTQSLVSISGYCGSITEGGPVIVRALTLETNRKNYGPFGVEEGAPFSLPLDAEMVVGFHGWSSKYLDAIGVYAKPLLQTKTPKMIPTTHVAGVPSIKKVLSLGPWGGDGGMTFDDGIHTGVREVHITRSGGLVSIRVCYDLNGKTVWGSKNGGTGGLKHDKIVFDYPYEVLTHIEGYYASTILRGPTIIKSITFHTNKRSYGPFGDQQGFSFTSGSIGGGAIVGFHGRNGYFVHSIGVHVLESKPFFSHPDPFDMQHMPRINTKVELGVPRHQDIHERRPYPDPTYVSSPKSPEVVLGVPRHQDLHERPPYPDLSYVSSPKSSKVALGVPRHQDVYERRPYPDPPQVFSPKSSEGLQVAWGVPRQPALNESGPWGGVGGKAWDDGVYSGVKQIVLTRGDAICSIQVQYIDQHGRSVWSAPHGIANDVCTYHIKFDYPYEVLTSISGNHDILVGDMQRRVIGSLTFHTNRAKYGPYGKSLGTYFSSANKEGKVVGFHGRSGTFLDAIGVHTQPLVSDEKPRYPPERGGFRTLLHKNNII